MVASPHRECSCFPESERDLDGRRREEINPSNKVVMFDVV